MDVKKIDKKKAALYFLLGFILVTNFILILWPLRTSYWWDETVYLQHAEVIFSGKENYDEFQLRPPILSMLFAFGFLFKHHVFAADIIVGLIGMLGTLMMYFLGKEISGKKVGLLAAAFFGFTSFIVRQAHSIMTDVPSLVFFAVAFYCLIKASKIESKKWYLLSGFFLGIAILTRFTQLILISVFIIYILVKKISLQKIRHILLAFSAVLFPYLLWAQLKFGFFLIPFIRANSAVSDQVGNIFFYIANLSKVYPLMILLGVIPYLIIVYKKRSWLDTVLVSWILIFLAYVSITPHKELRYILPITVPLFLISARGFVEFFETKKLLMKSLVIISIVLLGFYQLPDGEKVKELFGVNQPFINAYESPAQEISEYLVSLNETDRVIYANHEYPVYGYYTNLKIKTVYGGEEFYRWYPANMRESGFFVFYKEVKKYPAQEWLDSKKEFKKIKETEEIIVYRYNPSKSSVLGVSEFSPFKMRVIDFLLSFFKK
ncbi:MAG: glycosyltransferase family 39 protein [Candidatus Nanoarchaeia archaeon]